MYTLKSNTRINEQILISFFRVDFGLYGDFGHALLAFQHVHFCEFTSMLFFSINFNCFKSNALKERHIKSISKKRKESRKVLTWTFQNVKMYGKQSKFSSNSQSLHNPVPICWKIEPYHTIITLPTLRNH